MKPQIHLAETRTPDGASMTLHQHDGSFCIRVNGKELMHSLSHASEDLLGELAIGPRALHSPLNILIGGLGLGFTLRSVLERTGPRTTVHVAELMPAVVEWNRTFLADLNGGLLRDSRVYLHTEDVRSVLARAGRAAYELILLDIDNGPAAMVQSGNARLYDMQGIQKIASALKPGGRAAIWSAGPDRGFSARLAAAGFKVQAVAAKRHPNAKRPACTIYLADKSSRVGPTKSSLDLGRRKFEGERR